MKSESSSSVSLHDLRYSREGSIQFHHSPSSLSSKISETRYSEKFDDELQQIFSSHTSRIELDVAENQEEFEQSKEDKELYKLRRVSIYIKTLAALAIDVISANFIRIIRTKSVLDSLKSADRKSILSNIEEVPLKLGLDLIPDDVYWKRRCLDKYGVEDDSRYESFWKNIFVERFMQENIEKFDPSNGDYDHLRDHLKMCSRFMRRLRITQLKPVGKDVENRHLEEYGNDTSWHRINWNILAPHMTTLEELHIEYNVKDCGLDYDADMFKISNNDCTNLGKCLSILSSLKVFSLKNSSLEDNHVVYLVSHLVNHKYLQSLDLRHNCINDDGCKSLARLLLSECPIKNLILVNNRIGNRGAKYLSTALRHNNRLQHLNLTLNKIEDEGGVDICKSLVNSSTLNRLSMAGNNLGEGAGKAFVYVIKTTSCLTHLDLSANDLGYEVGFQMKKAIKLNKNLRVLDVRFCGFDTKTENVIKKIVLKRMENDDDSFFIL